GGGWTAKDIFMDSARAHEIRIGDIHPNDGNEIVLVGYSQNVTIISLREQTAAVPPSLSGESSVTLRSEGEASLEMEVTSDIDVSFSVDVVDGVEIELSSETMFLSGVLYVSLKADVITEDSNTTFNIYLDYAGGSMSYPVSLDLEGDDSAPTVSEIRKRDGTALSGGDEVSWNDTIEISFNEPITEASFEAARSGELLKVEWGGAIMDVLFDITADGKTISMDLNEQVLIGDITVTISGLKDQAGNEMETLSVELSVTAPEEDGKDNGLIIIALISAGLILVLVFGAVIFLMNKGGEETDMPKEPKLI
ncbi:MAG: Ig-like domain-containing protein, partial [Candidatus Thermoplasmatota archaeon]|nr:Ig-like domain-containing protein [Candidatus Thermoplasmatota archaeon]